VPQQPKTFEQSMVETLINRNYLFKEAAEKLINSQLARNTEIRRSVDSYSREFCVKYKDNHTIILD
jgi:hypothetical protein